MKRLPETRLAACAGAAEGKGAPHLARGRQASGCLSRSQRREKARRARGDSAQTSDCPGRVPRREKARRTRGDSAKTSGCQAVTRRVLPIHSDICLHYPALPVAGLN